MLLGLGNTGIIFTPFLSPSGIRPRYFDPGDVQNHVVKVSGCFANLSVFGRGKIWG